MTAPSPSGCLGRILTAVLSVVLTACQAKEVERPKERGPKKARLVFTDIQRRTLQAIFKETQRPSKEMQVTIATQLGLEVSTVGNFFMNARRRFHRFQDNDAEDNLAQNTTNMGMDTTTMCSQGWDRGNASHISHAQLYGYTH